MDNKLHASMMANHVPSTSVTTNANTPPAPPKKRMYAETKANVLGMLASEPSEDLSWIGR